MKISLVGCFNLHDGYLGAAKALERLGHEVGFVPAMKYKSEEKYNVHLDFIERDVKEQDPDLVLFWRGETLTGPAFIDMRNRLKKYQFAMYSWDDPFQWEIHKEMPVKCKNIDFAFSCCMGSVEQYRENGCSKSFYCLPGFDPEIHYPEESDEYKCDVSIVCTNLYDGPVTRFNHLSRKLLLDQIIKAFPDKDIRIYGPEDFHSRYGERAKGWISFNESRKVFRNSKINLSTHIRPDGFMYINERVTQVLGSGGLLLVDNVNGIDQVLKVGEECLTFKTERCRDLSFIKDLIGGILNNYDEFEEIREKGLKKALKDLTWDNWANTICNGIENLI